MGVTNIYRRLPYLGGICKWWYVPIQEVDNIPGINPLNQYLLGEPVLKADKFWRGPVPVPDSQLGFTETQKNDAIGTYYEVKLQAQAPGDAPQARINYDNMAYNRYLVVGKLRAGGFYVLLGSMDSPLDFDNIHSNGPGSNEAASTKIAFSGESMCRALVIAEFNGDESGYIYPDGVTGPSGSSKTNETEIIYITAESSKTITWTPTRMNKFGVFPEVECYLTDEDGALYKAPVQPTINAAPPYFTEMQFDFSGTQTGFISIK